MVLGLAISHVASMPVGTVNSGHEGRDGAPSDDRTLRDRQRFRPAHDGDPGGGAHAAVRAAPH
ncbi:hypothetical protein HOK021_01980 [Streptomyces hygroscopicus]|nr:hypothetical protein HOK021_01980 [Streptomyces hygroscopicus]